jgi:hypothetical protein
MEQLRDGLTKRQRKSSLAISPLPLSYFLDPQPNGLLVLKHQFATYPFARIHLTLSSRLAVCTTLVIFVDLYVSVFASYDLEEPL